MRAAAKPETLAHWPRETLDRLDAAVLAITPFTLAEEKYGYLAAGWGADRIERYEQRLRALLLIPLDLDIVDAYAELRFECKRAGQAFGYHDLWIGATARSRGIALVSCDDRQCKIPGIEAIYLPPDPPGVAGS